MPPAAVQAPGITHITLCPIAFAASTKATASPAAPAEGLNPCRYQTTPGPQASVSA